MRRVLSAAGICFFLIFPALAQRGGGHGGGGGGHAAGGGAHVGGGGVHVGGGGAHAGGFARGGVTRGGTFNGFRGGYGFRPGFRSGFGYRYPGFWPYYYGGVGYYDPYWDSSYAYPDSGYGYSYPSTDYGYQAPPVVVNPEFQPGPPPQPMVREYTAPGPPTAPARQQYGEPLYLIAFHSGDIRAVLAYWVQGSTLHYVTMDHEQKQATLASVDRALSERLNGERNVTFQLPR